MTARRYRLEPPALEAEFRVDSLVADERMATGLLIVAIVFLIASVPGRAELEGNTERLIQVWTIRGLDVAVAALALFLVNRAASPRRFDTIVAGWVAVWFIGIVAENALLPADSTGFVTWDVFLAVAAYAALPLPLPKQAVLAVVLSAGDTAVLWRFKSPGPGFEMSDVVLAYACANVVGVFVSRELQGWRRLAFLALKREIAANTGLQAALREVKTLQGIIPICSHCKRIRTDAGDWQEVEAYVHSHSDAQFSHGVCPACMKRYYPEVADE